jgi:hypothetical protein
MVALVGEHAHCGACPLHEPECVPENSSARWSLQSNVSPVRIVWGEHMFEMLPLARNLLAHWQHQWQLLGEVSHAQWLWSSLVGQLSAHCPLEA